MITIRQKSIQQQINKQCTGIIIMLMRLLNKYIRILIIKH